MYYISYSAHVNGMVKELLEQYSHSPEQLRTSIDETRSLQPPCLASLYAHPEKEHVYSSYISRFILSDS